MVQPIWYRGRRNLQFQEEDMTPIHSTLTELTARGSTKERAASQFGKR